MSAPHSPKRNLSTTSSADNSQRYDNIITVDPDVLPTDMRHRRRTQSEPGEKGQGEDGQENQENGFVMMPPENAIEAHRMVNNYKVKKLCKIRAHLVKALLVMEVIRQ